MADNQLLIIGNIQADLLMGNISKWPEMGTETILPHSDWRVGGSAGNTALALKEFNHQFTLLSSVGNDDIGSWLKGVFSFCSSDIPVCDTTTTISVGVIHDNDERTFLTSQGHLEVFGNQYILPELDSISTTGGIALLSGVFLSAPLIDEYDILIAQLRKKGFSIAIDPGWPSNGWDETTRNRVLNWFRNCDHILINDKEATSLTKTDSAKCALDQLSKILPETTTIIIKNGAEGALAKKKALTISIPAPSDKQPVDTVGAGDCFNAGYIYAINNNMALTQAVKMGVYTASMAIASFPRRYPTREEVEASIAVQLIGDENK